MDCPKPEWGRHGSPRADTLGKRSHGLKEGFEMPPGHPGGHILIKNGPTDPNIQNYRIFPYFCIYKLPINRKAAFMLMHISSNIEVARTEIFYYTITPPLRGGEVSRELWEAPYIDKTPDQPHSGRYVRPALLKV